MGRLQPAVEQVRIWGSGQRANPPQEPLGPGPPHVQQVGGMSPSDSQPPWLC